MIVIKQPSASTCCPEGEWDTAVQPTGNAQSLAVLGLFPPAHPLCLGTQGMLRSRPKTWPCLICRKHAIKVATLPGKNYGFSLQAFGPTSCFLMQVTREAQRQESLSCQTLGPHLFRLTIDAFCPALFKTSFHSSSSPRIMYLKIRREISGPA